MSGSIGVSEDAVSELEVSIGALSVEAAFNVDEAEDAAADMSVGCDGCRFDRDTKGRNALRAIGNPPVPVKPCAERGNRGLGGGMNAIGGAAIAI